jgi:hypothetical protein
MSSRPWSALQVLHPPKAGKTGSPRIITTRRRLQHSAKTRPHSAEWDSGSDYGEGGPMQQGHLKILRSGSSLHAAGPDLGDTHGQCLATPQHIPPLMNAIGAACGGLQLKRKSHTRCPSTEQAFLECVSLHCDGSFVFNIEALPSISTLHLRY